MDFKEILDRVIADTEYHVIHSADVSVHREPGFVASTLTPHLERIHTLLSAEESAMLLTARVEELDKTNALAALSLMMLIKEMRAKGVEGTLRVCIGLDDPIS